MNDSTGRTLPVLVCVDGSPGALDATRWAATYACRVNAPLRLVHTVPDGDWYGSARFVDGGLLEDELRRVGHDRLAAATATALTQAPGIDVDNVSADGEVTDVVASTRARLVVLGSPRSTLVHDIVSGSITAQVLDRSAAPVLIWRGDPGPSTMTLPVVVGVDGSAESDDAVRTAFAMAQLFETDVVAARFWGLASVAVGLGADTGEWRRVHAARRAWLISHVEHLRTDTYRAVAVNHVSTDAAPGRGLRALSRSAALVVVGAGGEGRLGGVLGSVSRSMVRHAECAVLVVHRGRPLDGHIENMLDEVRAVPPGSV